MNKADLAKAPRFLILLLAVGLLTALPRAASAQDPPGRVARLNMIEGSVSMQPAGTQDWLDANPNRPLTTGDGLWVGDGSRGELHTGSTTIRLAADTGISFLNLNDQALQIQLAQGTMVVRVRQWNPNDVYEVDTPNLAFTPTQPGEYRIDVDPNGNTTAIIVRQGSGEVTGGGNAYTLQPAQQGIFSGTAPLSFDNEYAPPADAFEQWSVSLDRREDASMSARYISREVIGYQDLDTYGTWRVDPVYGHVWVPSGVEAGWAPYHSGHWVNVAPWGWTWVDDQPWGFAPFHYGRWAYAGGGWAWVPGSVAMVAGRPPMRPMYAPALVAFVGGGGFSVSLSFGGGGMGVAWFPLGPRDVWVPAYHCSPAYMQTVNISSSTMIQRTQITNVYNTTVVNNVHVTNITYSNQNAPGAVTAVSRQAFVGGQSVREGSVKITSEQIQHPRVAESKPIAASEARPVPAASKPASIKPPASLANRPIVTKMKPAPQVVPLGYHETVARSNLVKAAPPATPKPAPPPGKAPPKAAAAAAKPAPVAAPAKPAARGYPTPAPPARPAAPETRPAQPVKPTPPAAKPAPAAAPARPAARAYPTPAPPAKPAAPEMRPAQPVKPAPAEAKKPAKPPAATETKKPVKPAPAEAKKPEKKTKEPEHP
jgi:hypothetical protein